LDHNRRKKRIRKLTGLGFRLVLSISFPQP
jgi:hypothetical protein